MEVISATTDNPLSLQDLCQKYIATNINLVFRDHPLEGPDGWRSTKVFPSADNVYLHSNLADKLLSTMSTHGTLTNDTLTVFDPAYTDLKYVKFHALPSISGKGLRMLRSHNIVELEATGLKQLPVNELIGCLGEWTLDNIKSLNVSGSGFVDVSGVGVHVIISLSKLRSLCTLNVSSTTFNSHALDIVTSDLPHLRSLDISETLVKDINPLLRCKHRLRSLSMYNLRVTGGKEVLCALHCLQHLDVSEDLSSTPFNTFNEFPSTQLVAELLTAGPTVWPELVAFDMSGNHDVSADQLRGFVADHPKLEFLGVSMLNTLVWHDLSRNGKYGSVPEFQHLTVTGEASEAMLIHSLHRNKKRPSFVKAALLQLFHTTQDHTSSPELRVDLVKVILLAMRCNPRDVAVHLAGTACFYNLMAHLRGAASDASRLTMHPRWLCEVVNATLDGMENFPLQQQLIKNCLLMLCSDKILQDLNFDKYRCTRLVLDSLCSFEDASMNRLAVAICGILAAKIPTNQTSLLGGNPQYMKKLLKLVKNHVEMVQPDVTLKFTLSALWNLSDEAPATCEVFVSEGGLEIFMDVYEAFKNESEDLRVQIEVKLLGFLNNMAEVVCLRKDLLREDIIVKIRDLLHSPHQDISYFSAGILSHLLCGGRDSWPLLCPSRQEMLTDLQNTVLNWKKPEAEMVAYRSFVPFFALLQQGEEPAVQLWALWAWHHVCSQNGPRYCQLIVNQNCITLLKLLVDDPITDTNVRQLANNVIDVVKSEIGGVCVV